MRWGAGLPSEQSKTAQTHCEGPWQNTTQIESNIINGHCIGGAYFQPSFHFQTNVEDLLEVAGLHFRIVGQVSLHHHMSAADG